MHERVRRLKAEGVLRGAHAEVDPAALGVGLQAMVFIQLASHSAQAFADFAAAVRALPEVLAVYSLAGRTDYLVHVAVKDVEQLRVLAQERLALPQVSHMETSLIFEASRRHALPCLR